jgi:DNA-binding MarR family transcriptional regulator
LHYAIILIDVNDIVLGGRPASLSHEMGADIVSWILNRAAEECRRSMKGQEPANSREPAKGREPAIPLEHWIGYRFGLIAARLGNYVAQMYASRHDLPMPAWRGLAVIARYQPLTAKELAMLTSTDAFRVTRAIELLVRRGLIRRDVDKEDRRRASLSLTAEGRRIYKDIEKFTIRVERELTAGLDHNDLGMLRQTLDKLDRQLDDNIRARAWETFLKD